MDRTNFGLQVKMNGKYTDLHPIATDLHKVKSMAGSLFHADAVESVCVYDAVGTACLYLRKMVDGTVMREERDSVALRYQAILVSVFGINM
jgi:hypothetical protein